MSAPADTPPTDPPPAVHLSGITKRFGPVLANDAIDLEIAPGTIHGIIGENGAGKSTLVSILYGFYEADAGTIEIDGKRVDIANASDAIALGIGMVHQHFMLVPVFTVLENVMLGAEGGVTLSKGRAETRAGLEELARDYGLVVDPDAITGDLPVGLQQRVEIVKALRRGARVLILDEPTGVLTPDETDRFFEILRRLAARGVTVLLITHKLREVMAVCDAVSVMRRGKMVAHRAVSDTSREELASLMVGRDIALELDHPAVETGDVALAAEGLGWRDGRGVALLSDVSITLRAGEILGVAGVAGNGQSELLDVLAGIEAPAEGRIRIGALEITPERPSTPAALRKAGLAHVPEDRHRRGLVLPFQARENAILGYHHGPDAGAGRWLNTKAMQARAERLMADYDVRPPAPRDRIAGFSGGNQQKLVLAREMEAAPRVLLIGQPTRGVDIGGIMAIHERILAMKAAGCAVLVVSVELDEILALSDRIAVMNGGRITGEIPRADATRETLGLLMGGRAGDHAPAPLEAAP
ncbi:MAG: ABC transporter ATP-binding protein [Pseudomonadota bacterium]